MLRLTNLVSAKLILQKNRVYKYVC